MVDPKIEMRMKEREEEKASLQLIARMSQLEPEGRGQGQAVAAQPARPTTPRLLPRTGQLHNQQSSNAVSQSQLDDHTWTKVEAKQRAKNNATKKRVSTNEDNTAIQRCITSEEWIKEMHAKEKKFIEKEEKLRVENQKIRLVVPKDNLIKVDVSQPISEETGLRRATLAEVAHRKSAKEVGRRFKIKERGLKDFEIEPKEGAIVIKERLADQARLRDEKIEEELLAREWTDAQQRKVSQAIRGKEFMVKKTKKK